MPPVDEAFRSLRPIEVRQLIEHLAATPQAETMHDLLEREVRYYGEYESTNSWYQAHRRAGDDYQEKFLRDVQVAWRDAEQRFSAEPSILNATRQIRYAMMTRDLRNHQAGLTADELIYRLQGGKITRAAALESALHSSSALRDLARFLLNTADDTEQCSIVARVLEPGDWDGLGVVVALADQLAPPAVSVVLDRTAGHRDWQMQVDVLTALATNLAAGHVPAVLRRVAALPEPDQRRAVLVSLAPRIRRGSADAALGVDGLVSDPTSTLAVLERLPEPLPAPVARRVLRAVRKWPLGVERAGAVRLIASSFRGSTQQHLIEEETVLARAIVAVPVRARAFFRLGGTAAVLGFADRARSQRSVAKIVEAVAPDLDADGIQRALKLTAGLSDATARALALGALIPQCDPLPPSRIVSTALKLAADPSVEPDDAAKIIVSVTPGLGPGGVRKALEVASKLRTPAARSSAVIALAPVLQGSTRTAALDVVAGIEAGSPKAAALAALIPVLPEARLQRALALLGTLPSGHRAEPRAALALRMGPTEMGRLAPKTASVFGGRDHWPTTAQRRVPPSRPPRRPDNPSGPVYQYQLIGLRADLEQAISDGLVDLRNPRLVTAVETVDHHLRHRALELALRWANSVTKDVDSPEPASRSTEPSPFPMTVGLLDRYGHRADALVAARHLTPYRRAEALAELAAIGPTTERAALAREAVQAVTEAARARSPAGVFNCFQVLNDLVPLLDNAGHRDLALALRVIHELPDGLFETSLFTTRLDLLAVSADDLKVDLWSDHLRAVTRADPSFRASWVAEVIDEVPLELLALAERITVDDPMDRSSLTLCIVARDRKLGGTRRADGLIRGLVEQGLAELDTGGRVKLELAAEHAWLLSPSTAAGLCCPGPGLGVLRVVTGRVEHPQELLDTIFPLFRSALGMAQPEHGDELDAAADLAIEWE